jgi:hypothetical protein
LNQTITKTANTLEKMFFLTVAFKLVEDDQQNVLESKPKQLRNTKNTESHGNSTKRLWKFCVNQLIAVIPTRFC